MEPVLQRIAARPATQPIAQAILSGNVDQALRAIEALVERVFCEPLNTAVIFSDPLLDEACQWIGGERLRAQQWLQGNYSDRVTSYSNLVCIASKLQRSGGHTAALADILTTPNWRGKNVTVLLTGVGGATKMDALQVRFSHLPNVNFEHAPRFNRLKKLDWLQRRLFELQPADVMLVNHHQDSTAVAGVQPNQGYKLHFLHHGDHQLCLGVHLPFAQHYDFHPSAFRNCRLHLGITDNQYLPLTLPDDNPVNCEYAMRRDDLHHAIVSCTVGGSNKIEVPYWLSYARLVPLVLAQTKGVHVHIGKLSFWYRLRILLALKRQGVARSRFKYLAQVDDVRHNLRQEQVDLYLTSFPYGGAKTMVEVMAAGIPMAVHVHTTHPFLSATDMAPQQSLLWQTPTQLLEWLSKQSVASLSAKGKEARRWYEQNHLPKFLVGALDGQPQSAAQLDCLLTKSVWTPDALGLALETAEQFTLAGQLQRKWKYYGRYVLSRFS